MQKEMVFSRAAKRVRMEKAGSKKISFEKSLIRKRAWFEKSLVRKELGSKRAWFEPEFGCPISRCFSRDVGLPRSRRRSATGEAYLTISSEIKHTQVGSLKCTACLAAASIRLYVTITEPKRL
jgi:hypothetical protein